MAEIQFSPKQAESFLNCNASINLWEGSVRAGKSYSSLWAWVKFVQEAPEGNLVIVGRTSDTIKRNVVDELFTFPEIDVRYSNRILYLEGRRIYCIGAHDERAEGNIRGTTFSGAYVDEATLIPESFFMMLRSRLSRPGARLFATTNPDSPFHWLKQNYIDRQHELNMKVFSFKMSDNPSLTPEFIDELKKEFQGLYAKRLIEGEWCLADGAIFPFFDEHLHTIKAAPSYAKMSFVGVDIGFSNPTAFSLISFNDETNPRLWVEDEYYHDASKQGDKTAWEYAQDLSKFVYGRNVRFVYVDPSAAAFKADLRRVDLFGIPVRDADNDVREGIKSFVSLMGGGDLKIMRNCRNLIQEIQSYTWDTKASERGEDKPVKKRDHLIDSVRYALYSYFGQKPRLEVPKQSALEGKTLGNPKSLLQPQNPHNPALMEKFDWNATRNIDQLKKKSNF